MIEETAVVSAVRDGRAWVEAVPKSACNSCQQKAGCSTAVMGKFLKRREIEVESHLELKQGDHVIVGIEENVLIRGSFILYLVPLVALFLGAVAGQALMSPHALSADAAAIVGAVAGFSAAFYFIRKSQNTVLGRFRVRPLVIRKI